MQYALEKILLPSLISQAEPPKNLRNFISWVLGKGLPILKKSNIPELQNIASFDINQQKLENFLNNYVDKQGLNTVEKLKRFRDSHSSVPKGLLEKVKNFGISYATKHPFDALSLKGDFESKLDSAKKTIKPLLQQNNLTESKLLNSILGLLFWAVQNFGSVQDFGQQRVMDQKESSTANAPTESDHTLLYTAIGGSVLLALGVGLFVFNKKTSKKKKFRKQ